MTKTSDAHLGMHILEVEITNQCNLNCKHCYNRDQNPANLPAQKIEQLYQFANKHSVWRFVISGGEALIHPDFDRIARYIEKNRGSTSAVLQTNGSLIHEAMIDRIRMFDVIHISYDLARDVRTSGYENYEKAILLKRNGLNSYLFSTIHKKNRHLIAEMVDKAHQADIPIGFNICLPTTNLDDSYIMSQTEIMETERILLNYYNNGKILRYTSPLTAVWEPSKKQEKFTKILGGCTAGIAACVVDPSGDVLPCPFLRLSGGNINKQKLENIWEHSPLFAQIRDRGSYDQPCGSCQFLAFCGGCRMRAYVSTGSLTGSDPMCYIHKTQQENI